MRGGLLFARRILLGERVRKSHGELPEAIRLNPKYVEAYVYRGIAHWHKGEYDKAIADHTEAIRLDPKDADAYNDRGLAYCNKDEYGRAIADFTKAIRFNPKYAIAYANRGAAYEKMGEHDKSISDYTEQSGSTRNLPRHTLTLAWPTIPRTNMTRPF